LVDMSASLSVREVEAKREYRRADGGRGGFGRIRWEVSGQWSVDWRWGYLVRTDDALGLTSGTVLANRLTTDH
jgi:hypothetical protein